MVAGAEAAVGAIQAGHGAIVEARMPAAGAAGAVSVGAGVAARGTAGGLAGDPQAAPGPLGLVQYRGPGPGLTPGHGQRQDQLLTLALVASRWQVPSEGGALPMMSVEAAEEGAIAGAGLGLGLRHRQSLDLDRGRRAGLQAGRGEGRTAHPRRSAAGPRGASLRATRWAIVITARMGRGAVRGVAPGERGRKMTCSRTGGGGAPRPRERTGGAAAGARLLLGCGARARRKTKSSRRLDGPRWRPRRCGRRSAGRGGPLWRRSAGGRRADPSARSRPRGRRRSW